ncbi:MAG: hypothetical protein HY907_11485 [Deltaproteobacteria bacterium]|nr:hypothetical protein [Deltaproteobacteria bacterium]
MNSGSAQVVRIVPFALVDADDDPLSDFKIVEKALARTEGEIDTKDRGALLARICGRYLLARPNPAELSDDDATEVFRLLERRTGVRLIIVHGTSFVPVYGIEVLAEVIDLLARGATETAGKTEGTSTDTTVDGER